jgi:iron(III) transport system substrate-binding protein
MTLVDGKNLFSKVATGTLANVPDAYEPSDADWVGFAARSTVLAYDPKALKPGDLPASILDLAQPRWKGRIGIAPAGADFQAIVSAVLATRGEAATATWLAGLEANAKKYPGNGAVMKAVNAGEIEAGVIYHYYWYSDRAESGANSRNTELHYFSGGDPGAFLSISGAGVLRSSRHQDAAQQLVAFLTSPEAQKILAGASKEYPIANGATQQPDLRPLSQLQPPKVDPATLNGPKVVDLMQRAGLL